MLSLLGRGLGGVRRRFGVGGVVAVVVFVFALSGGALAAGRYVVSSTKQISPKVLKALRGDAGPAGKAGAAGATGVAGAAGPAGSVGPAGPAGSVGPAGAAGSTGPAGAAGAAGPAGPKGNEGSPWTDGGSLPEGAMETGVWAFGPLTRESGPAEEVAISFPIPLSKPLEKGTQVHYVKAGEAAPAECTIEREGKVVAGTLEDPVAAAGNLCVYEGQLADAAFDRIARLVFEGGATEEFPGAGKSGALIVISMTHEPEPKGTGTWAVGAPEG